MLLVRPINEFPQPIAYKTHQVGMKMVRDLTLAHRFIMQKLAVSMLNILDQLNREVCFRVHPYIYTCLLYIYKLMHIYLHVIL